MKKKILIINNAFPSKKNIKKGSYFSNIYYLLKQIDSTDVKIIARKSSNGKISFILSYCLFYLKLISISFKRFDVIYLHHPLFYSFLFFIKKINWQKVFVHWHGTELTQKLWEKNYLFRLSYKLIFSKRHDINHISPSEYFKQVIAKSFDIKKIKIYESPSGGIDTSVFKEKKLTPSSKKKIIVGFASAVDDQKGYPILLKTLIEVSKIINLKLVFINYGKYVRKLKSSLKTHNIDFKLLPKMTAKEMADYYNSIDILFFPTHGESLGLVALEAIACNTPVLCTNDFSLKEFIIPRVSGELFDRNDLNEIINKFKIIHNNLDKYKPATVINNKYDFESVKTGYKYIFDL